MKYKVANISLAEEGRKELEMLSLEMPGLRVLKEKYEKLKPLKGARLVLCTHMSYKGVIFAEALRAIGAEVRCCSSNMFSTHDKAAAAAAEAGIPIFAWKGETPEEYEWCFEQAVDFGDGLGPNLVFDDGGDMFVRLIEKFPHLLKDIKGVAQQTTSGVHVVQKMFREGKLTIPTIGVNSSILKSKLDNIYGCRESLLDGIKQATGIMISGKVCVVCGFGDVGKGCARGLKSLGGRVIITEIDPINAFQATMEGFEVKTLEECASIGKIFVTTTGCIDVIRGEHMLMMKDNSLICNIGHHNVEIDTEWVKKNATSRECIKPLVDRYKLSNGRSVIILADGNLVNLSCGTGHPAFAMSSTFANGLLSMIELYCNKYEVGVHVLPKKVEEEVAQSHLIALGSNISKLNEKQASYLGVKTEGPFKETDYRY